MRALLFDLDGTLADTDDAAVARLARFLRRLPLQGDRDLLARRLVMTAETPLNALYAWADRLYLDEALGPLMDVIHRLRGEGRPRHFRAVPGVLPMLESLSTRYLLALVTARDHRSTRAFLENFGLAARFQVVVTARTCRRTKPHPAPVLLAAERLGLSPESCLMVGDTTPDIQAGRAAGAQTAGVLCGFGMRGELERAGANLILESTADLAAALKG